MGLHEPEWSAGVWKWRGALKAPGPGCAAQNGSATRSSSARRMGGAGNAMAGGRLTGAAALPPSVALSLSLSLPARGGGVCPTRSHHLLSLSPSGPSPV